MISIIIPVLNEADTIDDCLHSLREWSEHGHEIIVVDGGSADATIARASQFQIHLVNSGKGRARQLNAGAGQAHGELLLFLHVDTVLSEYSSALMKKLDIEDTHWGRFDVRLSGNHPVFPVIARAMNIRSRMTGIATGDQAMFVSHDLFKRVGGFPEQPLMEDIALSKKLNTIQKPVCIKDTVITSSRRWQKQGVFKTVVLMWILRFAYFVGVHPDRLALHYADN